MRRVEASGKTRKEAVEAALEQLRAELHEVKVEVLDEGSRGFLGLGARDVRVRVTLDTGEDMEDIPVEVDAATENRAADAAALLREMVERMNIQCTVRHEFGEGGTIRLCIDSPDSAILIGRKGKTLAALQYLINRMITTGDDSDKADRILVDIEGYLDRRRDSLEDLAQRLAQRAKETGKRVRLKPLDPQERRIIHMALQDDPDVETYSVGNASVRSVIIQPKGMAKTDESEDRPPRRERESARTSDGNDRSGGERSGRRRRGRGGRGRDRDGASSGGERASESSRPARADRGERRDSSGRGERRSEDAPRGGERREGARAERRNDNGPRGNDGGRREGGSRRDSGGRRRSGGGGGRRPQESSPLTPRSSALLGSGPIQVRPRPVAPAPAPTPAPESSAETPEP